MSSLIKIIKTKINKSYSISVKVDIALKRLIKKRTEMAHSLLRLYKLKAIVSRRKSILFEECIGGVCKLCPSPAKCHTMENTQTRQWKKLDRASNSIDDQIESIITLGEALDDGTRTLKKRLAYCQSLKSISSNTELDIIMQAHDLLVNLKTLETKVSGMMSNRGVTRVR
jgi:hypothetical protein